MTTLWAQIQPTLFKLYGNLVNDEEKALGIVQIKSTPGIMLRNWIGYKTREEILLLERRAYHSPKAANIDLFKSRFNNSLATEVKQLMFRFHSEGNSSKFEEIVAYKGVLCEKVGEEEYRLNSVFS